MRRRELLYVERYSAMMSYRLYTGTFSAEVLSPDGRIPVNIRHPDMDTVQVGFTAKVEGRFMLEFFSVKRCP